MKQALIDYAKAYAQLGWSVIPIQNNGKRSKVKWEKFQRERATENQIDRWWKKWPNANVGIITGSVSDIIVVDIDSKTGRENYIQAFGELHNTISQTSGKPGAIHLVFKHPQDKEYANMAGIYKDVDVRADGGYIVAAPSIHANGTKYKWNIDPTEMGLDDLMDLPDDVKSKLTAGSNNGETVSKNPEGWVQEALMGVPEGKRNDTCAKLAGYYIRVFDGDLSQVKTILLGWNDKNEPPLDWKEIIRTIKSVANREKNNKRDLPKINAKNKDLPTLAKQAWDALTAANNPPKIFTHSAGLVRLRRDEENGLFQEVLSQDGLRHLLARVANWYSGKNSAFPPMDIVRDMLADPDPPPPYLLQIVKHPLFASDKTFHFADGYLEATKCYYDRDPAISVPDVPQKPTFSDIKRALELIYELVNDFPFTTDSERAHVIALFILPFVRNLIPGPTPNHLFEAPGPGHGKSLLVESILYPALGYFIIPMNEGQDEDEWRKRLTAALLDGPSFIFIDDFKRRLDSSALASAITSATWSDRILSKSKIVRLPIRCGWITSGNNPTLSSEIARRSIRIRLDAKMDKPWTRQPESFLHPDIKKWVKEYRGKLIWSALTMSKAWIAENCPEPEGINILGTFEDWRKVIGGILQVVGVPGFLGNFDDFYEESDAEGAVLRTFINEWFERYGKMEVGVSELNDLIINRDIPLELGKSSTQQGQKTKLGKFLAKLRDRQVGNYRVVRGKTRKRAQLWKLYPVHIVEVNLENKLIKDHHQVHPGNSKPDKAIKDVGEYR
jgi:hypothetical protein